MTWVRLDDMFTIHRKVAGLSDAAFRLHVSALCWSARNLMDGFVPEADLEDVCARVRTPSRFAAECVRRGAWHPARQPCESRYCPEPVDEDGWRLHDYFEYQFSKEQVIHTRETNREKQKRHRSRVNGVSNPVTDPVSHDTPARPDPSVVDVVTEASPGRPRMSRKPGYDSQRLNGTASRHPSAIPFSEAVDRALHPEAS